MHVVNALLLAALASSAAALNRFDPGKLTAAAAKAQRRTAGTTSTAAATAATADTASDDTYTPISDSRTTDPAYTSSCESKLFSSLYTAFPTPTDDAVFSMLQASQGPCLLSVPAQETSALAVYESSVSAWFAPISSEYYALFSECPYLEDYKFTEINGVFVPAQCTAFSGVGFASSATATGTGTGSAATAGGATTTGGASAAGSATGAAATTTASGNGSPRATGIVGAAVAVAGVLGAVAAL